MGDLSQLKEDLEQKITTWEREVDLKLMKIVWGAHVRTPEEDDLSEECVCEPPRACLCCHRPPEMVEQDLLYAYQGLKDTTKGEESVEDHLPTSITQGASNLHSDEDMGDKIKLLDPRVQNLIRTYLEAMTLQNRTLPETSSTFFCGTLNHTPHLVSMTPPFTFSPSAPPIITPTFTACVPSLSPTTFLFTGLKQKFFYFTKKATPIFLQITDQ